MDRKCCRHKTVLFGLSAILALAIGAGAQQLTSALMTGMATNAKATQAVHIQTAYRDVSQG